MKIKITPIDKEKQKTYTSSQITNPGIYKVINANDEDQNESLRFVVPGDDGSVVIGINIRLNYIFDADSWFDDKNKFKFVKAKEKITLEF